MSHTSAEDGIVVGFGRVGGVRFGDPEASREKAAARVADHPGCMWSYRWWPLGRWVAPRAISATGSTTTRTTSSNRPATNLSWHR